MQNFAKLKYAELRKLAKKAGIKANLKHEKLVAELTKFYEKHGAEESEKPMVQAKVLPKTPTLVTKPKTPVSAQNSRTPILVAKRQTPSSKPKTPTQVERVTPNQQGKPMTPGSAKPVSRWEKRVFSPAIAVRPATPVHKSATPTIKPATPQTRPTLASSRPASSPKVAGKRKQTDTPEVSQPAKKRRSTFEKVATPDLKSPKIGENNTKNRRSTFEKVPTPNLKTPEIESPMRRRSGRQSAGSSQSVTEMLGAMNGDMNDEEMKQSLLSVLDKNVQDKAKAAPAPGSTSIPRFAAFVKKRQEAKPITPGNKDWDKIHKKNFDKFDSIDVYLNKKRKRAEEMTASVKKAKTLLSEVRTAVDKLKSHKTPDTNENKFVKPRVSNANKTTPFKPTVVNTSKMNLNFGTKKSPKTLPRNPTKPVVSSTVKSTQPAARKSTGSVAQRKSLTTPFKFTAVNPSTLNHTIASTKKPAFDLKASLARPITWKPHKGKLKPVDSTTKSPVYSKAVSAAKIKKDREVTRTNVAKRRADKKHNAQMARRGIKI
ncbi:nucleolar and spindle-associated protein 1-like [Mercenaria mercenaria]|uniref:nucleolar and spindle-associated protein 1-like n=1 Tax=Mercenaria mercenaria TaxID=6596 RepID=UPI00234F17C8|nr:nucleolar and spindle-associated protein 1-like [Mercenaria mercenaria]